jgi:hypothetical protein
MMTKKLIIFLHMKDTFKDSSIDEDQHDLELNCQTEVPPEKLIKDKKIQSNTIPKPVVRLENIYDLQDKFNKVTNYKTNKSSMQYEIINLGTNDNPQTVNLGINCSPGENKSFMKLFRE